MAVDFMPVAQPEALPHFLEVEIGGETYTLLLQLNGRKNVYALCVGQSNTVPQPAEVLLFD